MSKCHLHFPIEREEDNSMINDILTNPPSPNCGNCAEWMGYKCKREEELKKKGVD